MASIEDQRTGIYCFVDDTRGYTLDRLIRFLNAPGHDVRITIRGSPCTGGENHPRSRDRLIPLLKALTGLTGEVGILDDPLQPIFDERRATVSISLRASFCTRS